MHLNKYVIWLRGLMNMMGRRSHTSVALFSSVQADTEYDWSPLAHAPRPRPQVMRRRLPYDERPCAEVHIYPTHTHKTPKITCVWHTNN